MSGLLKPCLVSFALLLCLMVTGEAAEYGVPTTDSIGGLGINYDSATDFASRIDAEGWYRQFLWGNNAAFEKDWKDVTKGGWDDRYADAADLAFFEGHGSPSGIYCPNDCCDDNKCSKDDAEPRRKAVQDAGHRVRRRSEGDPVGPAPEGRSR